MIDDMALSLIQIPDLLYRRSHLEGGWGDSAIIHTPQLAYRYMSPYRIVLLRFSGVAHVKPAQNTALLGEMLLPSRQVHVCATSKVFVARSDPYHREIDFDAGQVRCMPIQ